MRSVSRPDFGNARNAEPEASSGELMVTGLFLTVLLGFYFGSLVWMAGLVLVEADMIDQSMPWWAFVRLGVLGLWAIVGVISLIRLWVSTT
jgi:hypothetical protein